jgi:hypothetical protein
MLTDRIEMGENAWFNCTFADYSQCLSSVVGTDRIELGENAGFNFTFSEVSVYLVLCGETGQNWVRTFGVPVP